MHRLTYAVLLNCIVLAPVAAAATIPTECESLSTAPERLYSYFGGVASFSTALSSTTVFSGSSMALTVNFQPSFFATAGVGIGSLGVSAPALNITPDADTFSITIKGPQNGTLKFYVLVREDDSADGVIDLANGDDEWQSPELIIPANTVTTFNISLADFVDSGAGSGNGVQEFTTTSHMGLVVDIHSNSGYPGGLITSPRTLYLDHIGFFLGAQVAPPAGCPGDADGNLSVDFRDITGILAHFGLSYAPDTGPGDADGNGVVGFEDITSALSNWGSSCE